MAKKRRKKGNKMLDDSTEYHAEPIDMVVDERTGVEVSRFGQHKGLKKQDTRVVSVEVDGKAQDVNVIKDGLYKMRESGSVSDSAYKAGRMFHWEFLRGHYDSCSTSKLEDRTSGGNMTIHDIYIRSHAARDYVHYILKMLGGDGSPMACMICDFIGRDKSIRTIVKERGESAHYWRGVLFSAMHLLAEDYERMNTGKRRGVRHRGIS